MDFFAMLQQVKAGKAMTRVGWNNPDLHVCLIPFPQLGTAKYLAVKTLENKPGSLPSGVGFFHEWIIGEEDMDATDWEETALAEIESQTTWPPRPTLVARPGSSPVPKKKKEDTQL